jgi:hypothetical protein
MKSLEGLAIAVVIKTEEAQLKRLQDELRIIELSLKQHKERQWDIIKEADPTITECRLCRQAIAYVFCRVCKWELCWACVVEREDDYDLPYVSCGDDMCFYYGR